MKKLFCLISLAIFASAVTAIGRVQDTFTANVSLKVPGNPARLYLLSYQQAQNNPNTFYLNSPENIPLRITQDITESGEGMQFLTISITAIEDVYFNFGLKIKTDYRHDGCLFYMPGFWYRHNLRSPKEAPSFHTSDSWVVREDRLSSPLTGLFSEDGQCYLSVSRFDPIVTCALSTHKEGEIILSGKNSLGYTGFENINGKAALCVGFPYKEAPKSYIRKLTLAPSATAYQYLKKGESILLKWKVQSGQEADFSTFVSHMWESCYDTYHPTPINDTYSVEQMKQTLSQFFIASFIDKYPLAFNSGIELRTADCASNAQAEVGFIGRVLLNAFNAWEYGWQQDRNDLKQNSERIFASYLKNGFTRAGFLKESVNFEKSYEDPVHSIRRQSEGLYAMFHFLAFEKKAGRKHPEWEQRLRTMLNLFLQLQNADGSFPRKFRDDFSIADSTGGSTPSATLPLVMGYKYFKDKRYLDAAKRTASYLENEIISKADYFSSTLDANCEDKEASLYAAEANYYLALVTQGKERQHYANLAKQSAYFALSWYYLWDVPFAPGQMLGDMRLKTRGWGNVSTENNHIDVFVFGFADVLRWLAKEYAEPRFSGFADVISTSMRQLLPFPSHLCGVAKEGYYPEVVQHTIWDYGKNGKGYYNDIFAPGWTVASLWELLTPGRAEAFLSK